MKNKYDRIKEYKPLFDNLTLQYGLDLSHEIKEKANEKYLEMEETIGNVPKEERKHITLILERAALYVVLKDSFPDETYEWIRECIKNKGAVANKMFAKMTKCKAGAKLFIKMWGGTADSGFGDNAGFKKNWVKRDQYTVTFDMLECPYVKYLKILDCPELIKSFCDSDVDAFGNLPNIAFKRTQTLGTGGCKCDFDIKLNFK